jgi:hypothetical protein
MLFPSPEYHLDFPAFRNQLNTLLEFSDLVAL